ncbi:MAG TPA: hypothetical protein VJ783_18740 [Pirellulales bacterium]|nr:hypothetical protein [Pirellulales bacterium]
MAGAEPRDKVDPTQRFVAAMPRQITLPGHRWPTMRMGNIKSNAASFCPSHRKIRN